MADHLPAREPDPPQEPRPREDGPIIVVRGLWKSLGERPVLRDVSLSVAPGEIFVIMGPSGAGKTVLLRHLVGLLRPDRGTIEIWGQPIHAIPAQELDALRRRIGVVFQSAALFDSMSVGENVAFPLRRHRRLPERTVGRIVAEKLALVDLEGTEALMPAHLSGGMRKRVGIARALALDPEIIFYDEPTSMLDPLTARTVDALIARLRDQLRVTSVVVTHDLETAFATGDRIAVLWDGRLLAAGTPEDIVRDRHEEVRAFLHQRVREDAVAGAATTTAQARR